MPDPAADAAASAAMAVVSGAATVTVAALGVHPQVLFWSGVGAGFGLLATRAETRGRAFAFWALTTVAGALLAHLAARYAGGDDLVRNGVALALGMVFPSLRERAMAAAPSIVDAVFDTVLRRIGVAREKGDKP